MGFRIAWDENSEGHIARHGVTPAEVEAALTLLTYWRSHRGGVVAIGRTRARTLFIVLARRPDHPGYWAVITARDATTSEKRLLRRRAKGSP